MPWARGNGVYGLHKVPCAPFAGGTVLVHGERYLYLNASAAAGWTSLTRAIGRRQAVEMYARLIGVPPTVAGEFLDSVIAWLDGEGVFSVPPEEEDSAERAEPPAGAPALDAMFAVGPVPVRVICYDAAIAATVECLAAPARLPPDGQEGGGKIRTTLAIYAAGDRYVVAVDGRPVRTYPSRPWARWGLIRQMVRSAHYRQRQFTALLHAAAVAPRNGKAIVIAGDSGDGKSTLCAALVAAGLGYLADDIVPLDGETQTVWPVPLAISVKQGGWPVAASLFPGFHGAPTSQVGNVACRFWWPCDQAVPVSAGGMLVDALVFPHYQPGAPLSVADVTPADALAILGNTGSVLPRTSDELAVFLAWLERVPAHELTYGCLDDAIAAVHQIGQGGKNGGGIAAACVRGGWLDVE